MLLAQYKICTVYYCLIFSGKPNETFEFGNSDESCNSDEFGKSGDFEKKVWNLVLFEKNGQFGNPIKYSAYENFGVLC